MSTASKYYLKNVENPMNLKPTKDFYNLWNWEHQGCDNCHFRGWYMQVERVMKLYKFSSGLNMTEGKIANGNVTGGKIVSTGVPVS